MCGKSGPEVCLDTYHTNWFSVTPIIEVEMKVCKDVIPVSGYACEFEGTRCDAGDKTGYFKAHLKEVITAL
jgi:hypothetical protein